MTYLVQWESPWEYSVAILDFESQFKASWRKMLTKKYSQDLKVESYFIWWECLGLWAQETPPQ